jgi:hypothetical protein
MRNKKLVLTYTNLNTYDTICPYQMYRRYIVRDIPYVASAAMAWGNEVHSAFEYRIGGKKPLPDNMRQWEPFALAFDGLPAKVELQLGMTLDGRPTEYMGNDVELRGKVDCVVMQNSAAYFIDWKSGSSKYESPFELEIGALLLQAHFPVVKTIMGNYAWLQENRLSVSYNLSDTAATLRKVNDLAGKIKADQANKSFQKKKGPLCGFCDVKDCEFNRKAA